jgi:hypothetical protein
MVAGIASDPSSLRNSAPATRLFEASLKRVLERVFRAQKRHRLVVKSY